MLINDLTTDGATFSGSMLSEINSRTHFEVTFKFDRSPASKSKPKVFLLTDHNARGRRSKACSNRVVGIYRIFTGPTTGPGTIVVVACCTMFSININKYRKIIVL